MGGFPPFPSFTLILYHEYSGSHGNREIVLQGVARVGGRLAWGPRGRPGRAGQGLQAHRGPLQRRRRPRVVHTSPEAATQSTLSRRSLQQLDISITQKRSPAIRQLWTRVGKNM